MQEQINPIVASLYVVKCGDGDSYFAGFDSSVGKTIHVTNPLEAKLFSNKHDIKLRPDETIVELKVDLSNSPIAMSKPFRPHRRKILDK